MALVRLLAVILTAAAVAAPAGAEKYPTRPIRIVVSTSAGGITDIAARILGNALSTKTGQTVVIDNRSGAGGNIAMDAVAKSAPDGYTLGVANTGNIVINPFLYRQMPYDPLNDLVPVASLGEVPIFLVPTASCRSKACRTSSLMQSRIRSATRRPAQARRRTSPPTRSTVAPG